VLPSSAHSIVNGFLLLLPFHRNLSQKINAVSIASPPSNDYIEVFKLLNLFLKAYLYYLSLLFSLFFKVDRFFLLDLLGVIKTYRSFLVGEFELVV
jgi:hypothetical protein